MSDMRSVKNSSAKGSDQYLEQMRQKIGTEFTDKRPKGNKKNELGKDDFIKLMTAQLKHQDPLSPLKNEEMAAQLAQFSSLEQMTNVNQNIEKLAAAQKPTENVLAASLIGKRVMTDSSRFNFEKGSQPELKFNMPADAANVSVSIIDKNGESIRDFDLGSLAKGGQSIRWDGKNGKALDAPVGEYTYRINAVNADGAPINIENSTSGLVSGIVFEGGKAQLLVDGKKIAMEAVGRIELDKSEAASAPTATATANPAAAPAAATIKQNLSTTAESKSAEKNDVVQKNSLPPGFDEEKIKNMLGALGGGSRMELNSDEEGQGGAITQPNAMPLWNPAEL